MYNRTSQGSLRLVDYLFYYGMIKGSTGNFKFEELLRAQCHIFAELGIPVDFKKRYCNPLRRDRTPGCTFTQASSGVIYFNDWARPNYSGNAYKLYRLKHSKNPDTRVYGPPIKQPTPVKKKKLNATYLKSMTQNMIDYFSLVGVDAESIKGRYKMLQVSRLFLGEQVIMPADLTISYLFPSGREKIYRPFAENSRYKWTSNTSADDIWGFDPLADKYCITSSMKDAITLQSEDPYTCYIAPQSERQKFSYELIDKLRANECSILFDNDEPGIEAAMKYKQFDIPAFVVPTHKDPYGFKSKTKKLILPNLVPIEY